MAEILNESPVLLGCFGVLDKFAKGQAFLATQPNTEACGSSPCLGDVHFSILYATGVHPRMGLFEIERNVACHWNSLRWYNRSELKTKAAAKPIELTKVKVRRS